MRFLLLLICFLVLTCQNPDSKLPILSYNYDDEKKEIYKIDDFQFVNQNNDTVTSNNTLDKVHTMNFFFTSCPSICPPMRIKQLEIAATFKDEPDFIQYSISMDLKTDTIEQLRYYAEVSGIELSQWNLLRANSEEDLQKIAKALKTNFTAGIDGEDFYHSSYVALIDREQYIRGYYNILVPNEVELLKKDIALLLE